MEKRITELRIKIGAHDMKVNMLHHIDTIKPRLEGLAQALSSASRALSPTKPSSKARLGSGF